MPLVQGEVMGPLHGACEPQLNHWPGHGDVGVGQRYAASCPGAPSHSGSVGQWWRSTIPARWRLASRFLAGVVTAACVAEPPDAPSFGYVDAPLEETVIAERLVLSGWALDGDGVAALELLVDGRLVLPARYGVARPDVERAHPGYPQSAGAGFEAEVDARDLPRGHHHVDVVVRDARGRRTVIAQRQLLNPQRQRPWRALLEARPALRADHFHVLFASSNLRQGGGAKIKEVYEKYESETLRVGVRVPILYMRSTLGRAGDWAFDSGFDVTRAHAGKQVVEDSLDIVMRWAEAQELPVLFTLNGGIWGDARDTVPDWDLTDHLEEDPVNCQWNERGEVMPDDWLHQLPGSEANPELARALTFNAYADKVHRYKRRNLQQVGRQIKAFAVRRPHLVVGVSLEPDLYINPFFEGDQWYDYHPDTVRQFRHWLAGTGPYQQAAGALDLRRYRRAEPLPLEQVETLSGKRFSDWSQVQPPIPAAGSRYWEDPYFQLWEHFRRHLVDRHYDQLSEWLAEVGLAPQQVYSAQGVATPGSPLYPVAVRLDSPAKNYDTAGVSIEGAVPARGHLGVIIYGGAARNTAPTETGDALFALFQRFDPDWAVVEFNIAEIPSPRELLDYATGYRVLRDLFNHQARFISPMAWNGSDGLNRDDPSFVAYTALRNTPFEKALKDFFIHYADLPRRAMLWTFGTAQHADDDGWRVRHGTQRRTGYGLLELEGGGEGALVLESPTGPFYDARFDLLVLGVAAEALTELEVEGRLAEDGPWVSLHAGGSVAHLARSAAGVHVPLDWSQLESAQSLRLKMRPARPGQALVLDHIALYPRGDG